MGIIEGAFENMPCPLDRNKEARLRGRMMKVNPSFAKDLNTSFSGACRGICLIFRQKELNLATAFQNLAKFYGGVEKCLI